MTAASPLAVIRITRRLAAAMALVAGVSCVPQPIGTPSPGERAAAARLPEPLLAADSATMRIVAPGVVQHTIYRRQGPWAIHVLDVDRASCWTPAVLKHEPTATGRATTSSMLARAQTRGDTVAAVNADFFLFSPPGVPTGAHVDDGRVIAGPGTRPVLSIDSAGAIHLGALGVRGFAVARRDSAAITEWNRQPVTRLGVFDERWGVWTDSSVGTLRVVVTRDGKVFQRVTGRSAVGIPRGGWVLAAGPAAPASVRRWLSGLRVGDVVTVRTALTPLHPRDAVGGFPMLVRDSARAAVLDSAHTRSLGQARHPRTAVGLGRDGRRLLLVVVDGRQPDYSAGMTLPELADLMLEIGARDALNLDGGGSSAMVVRDADGSVQVVNRPSDPTGERAVGNALAVVKGCPAR